MENAGTQALRSPPAVPGRAVTLPATEPPRNRHKRSGFYNIDRQTLNFLVPEARVMGFLVGEFGFERGEAEVISYECSVAYRKLPNVALKVICELTAVPWLSLTVRSVLIFGTLLLVGWYTYDG